MSTRLDQIQNPHVGLVAGGLAMYAVVGFFLQIEERGAMIFDLGRVNYEYELSKLQVAGYEHEPLKKALNTWVSESFRAAQTVLIPDEPLHDLVVIMERPLPQ